MAEHQSGILNKLKDGEVIEDVNKTSLEAPEVVVGDEATGEPVVDPLHAYNGVPWVEDEEHEYDSGILADLDTEDWMSKLKEDEIFNSEKGPAPRLCGLRRLAKPYIFIEESKVNSLIIVPREFVRVLQTTNGEDNVMSKTEVVGTHNFPMASVTFNITLHDGRTFSDSADAFYSNCETLALFPTAVASARAEARCLRKVLGIRQHAAEEIVDKDPGEEMTPDDDSPIQPVQSRLIDKILKSIDMSLKDLLEEVTIREVFATEELT